MGGAQTMVNGSSSAPIRLLEDLPQLAVDWCHMKHPDRVNQLLTAMVNKGGAAHLQLVSDFDFTLTRQHKPDGSTMPTSFCILHQCKSLPDAWRTEAPKAVVKYLPIEQDTSLPLAERVAAVEDWSRLTSSLLRYEFQNIYQMYAIK